mmetsp:Transcript_23507/g.81456  ORF Transcript_23507/g.81456 Transcript_23507/m.81456 type:complete len:125 (-) Transcript_23507:132-506(-)
MPSSHACSLFHLGTGAVLQLANGPISPTTTAAAAALLSAYAVASVVWRVRARYHTAPQIVVGALFGAGSSCVWFAAARVLKLEARLASSNILRPQFLGLLLFAGAVVVGSLERAKLFKKAPKLD